MHLNKDKLTYNLHTQFTYAYYIDTHTIAQMKNCKINAHVEKFKYSFSFYSAIDTIEESADSSTSET